MIPSFTGRIIEWDAALGHGWVEANGQRIFLHRREFAELRKRPAIGDVIRFTAGTGPTGLLCARDAVHLSDGGRLGFGAAAWLLSLLVLPTLALARLQLEPRFAASYAVVVSLIAYAAYARDKRRARMKGWRVPEATLHFFELIGGWPGAFIAQRRLRHKCSKRSYQVAFWLIVLGYEFIALESLNEWRLTKQAIGAIRAAVG
ncbi:MAG: DUF1294 domain-containing protein [Spartobacteria bacterium]